ncbi:hypothetical protein J6590_065144 [Homalodisca vitripennis]|nr:hypothetical protein J6590_065144 [Homalodisca vitripennis]
MLHVRRSVDYTRASGEEREVAIWRTLRTKLGLGAEGPDNREGIQIFSHPQIMQVDDLRAGRVKDQGQVISPTGSAGAPRTLTCPESVAARSTTSPVAVSVQASILLRMYL